MDIRIRADSVKLCLHLHLDSIMFIAHIYLLEKIKDHTPALLRGLLYSKGGRTRGFP